MAVKTITVDMDAYDLLRGEKLSGESFSKVIKRRLRPAKTALSLLNALPKCRLSDETLDYTEGLVLSRKQFTAESPSLEYGE